MANTDQVQDDNSNKEEKEPQTESKSDTKLNISTQEEQSSDQKKELVQVEAVENKKNGSIKEEEEDDNKDKDITSCDKCKSLSSITVKLESDKLELEEQLEAFKTKLETTHNELEREVQRRCDLEQRFTEEAKRSTDQIEELIAKSDQDDARLSELKKKFELYSRETSSMIENFTTNREVLTSQLLDLRQENDYLLGKFIGRSRELQNEEINLPQTVEELQFHCLTLNEKLILATLAKEQLEETLMRNTSQ